MPERLCQLARVWVVKAAESKVPWSNSISSCTGEIAAMVMLLLVLTPLFHGGFMRVLRGMSIDLGRRTHKLADLTGRPRQNQRFERRASYCRHSIRCPFVRSGN